MHWAPEEDRRLREAWSHCSVDELGQKLSTRTKDAIRRRAWTLGLRRARKVRNTPATDAFIRTTYGKIPCVEIGKILGKSKNSIIGRMRRLRAVTRRGTPSLAKVAFLDANP